MDWPVIVLGMVLATIIAWTLEWLAWREAEVRWPAVERGYAERPRTVRRIPPDDAAAPPPSYRADPSPTPARAIPRLDPERRPWVSSELSKPRGREPDRPSEPERTPPTTQGTRLEPAEPPPVEAAEHPPAAKPREPEATPPKRSWIPPFFRGGVPEAEAQPGPPSEPAEELDLAPVAERPVAPEAAGDGAEEKPDGAERDVEERAAAVPPAEKPPSEGAEGRRRAVDVPVPPKREIPEVESPVEQGAPSQPSPPPRRFPPPRAVPPAPPRPRPPAPVPQRPTAPSVASATAFSARRNEPREWNLWDLERLAREENCRSPERAQEWSYLFLNLRQYAAPGGALPPEFDALIRDSFGPLLARIEQK